MTITAKGSDGGASGVSSRDLQKARQIAKRNRTSVACHRCKAGKTKCSDYRPCKQCSMSNAAQSCIQSSPMKSDTQADYFPIPDDLDLVTSPAARSVESSNTEFNTTAQFRLNYAASQDEKTAATPSPPQTIHGLHSSQTIFFGQLSHHEQLYQRSLPANSHPAYLHQPFLVQQCTMETAPCLPCAPTNSPWTAPSSPLTTTASMTLKPIHHLLAAQGLHTTGIGLPSLGPTLPPVLPSSTFLQLPSTSAGLPPAVAALLGHGGARPHWPMPAAVACFTPPPPPPHPAAGSASGWPAPFPLSHSHLLPPARFCGGML
jgi:hypothetical protein